MFLTKQYYILVDEARNRLGGSTGSQMDRVLAKNPRNCRIIGVDMIGVEKSDGNFTGGLGMLQLKTVDMILTGSSQYLTRSFFRVRVLYRKNKIQSLDFK